MTDGVEELEAIAPIDILRRAGVECCIASALDKLSVTGRNDINIICDCHLSGSMDQPWDLVVIPGGPGVASLRKNEQLVHWVKEHATSGKWTAAICAAPTLLKDAGLLQQRQYTAHFSVESELPNILDQKVVIDGNIITSRGAGTAIDFGLALAELLSGQDVAKDVADSMHFS